MSFARTVVICFQISIFEPLETTHRYNQYSHNQLWFAFKLVSLNHWKQHLYLGLLSKWVVICFQISIFEPLETTESECSSNESGLWFAFKLVSLNHWKQHLYLGLLSKWVVICFQISIFEPLETTESECSSNESGLWFAFKLVSLNHWKQHNDGYRILEPRCDLLSN